LPPAIVLRVVADACAGLHAAHLLRDRGGKLLNVVHGDASSRTIVVGVDGVTKVTGFGIAKARARAGAGVNATLFRRSDAVPAPPEGQKLDRHADVWAVGATLRELVGHLAEEAPADGSLTLGSVIADLVKRALSSDPVERFATAAEMNGAIEA